MKFLFKYFFILACLSGFSQRIINFNVSLNGATSSQVLVRFTIAAGPTLPGYEIQSCTDSLNYLQIYSNYNSIGDPNTNQSFSYTHNSPVVGVTNFYRINIPGFETSLPQRIYVGATSASSKANNIRVYPNPCTNDGIINLQFINYGDSTVNGYIYNQFGTTVQPLSLIISQGLSQVNINNLNDGLYIVWLTDGNLLFRAKFIVKRT